MPSNEKFKVSLTITDVQQHVAFLEEINSLDSLSQPHIVLDAVRRYESFWLPLLAKYDSQADKPAYSLKPPIDIEWIWHVHLLSPYAYRKDCNELLSLIPPDRGFINENTDRSSALTFTKDLWKSMFPNEEFEFNADNVPLIPADFTSKLKYDLVAACQRQRAFYYNISLPHYADKLFLETAMQRYKKFLGLKKDNSDSFIVPMYDVDLIWHTHQLKHNAYKHETEAILGKMLNHDDTTNDRNANSKLVESDANTRQLWLAAYNEQFPIAGAMYRGKDCSGNFTTVCKEDYIPPFQATCDVQVLSITMTSDSRKPTKLSGNITLQHTDGTSYESRPLNDVKSDSVFQWNDVLSHAHMSHDELSDSQLIIELSQPAKAIKGLLGYKKTMLQKTLGLKPLITDLSKASAWVLPKDLTFTLMTDDDKLQVSVKITMVRMMPERFKLRKCPFTEMTITNSNNKFWQPVALPALPDGIPNTVLQATHRSAVTTVCACN